MFPSSTVTIKQRQKAKDVVENNGQTYENEIQVVMIWNDPLKYQQPQFQLHQLLLPMSYLILLLGSVYIYIYIYI